MFVTVFIYESEILETTYMSNSKGVVKSIMVGEKQHSLAAKSMDSGISPPGLKSWLCRILACNLGNLSMPYLFSSTQGMTRVPAT